MNEERLKLDVPDLEEAEELASAILDIQQQGIIVHTCRNPAVVRYALGKNPKTAESIAKIKDPLIFAAEMRDFENKLDTQMKTRKPDTKPEKKLENKGSGSVDNQLEKLREEAAKTGDYTKVIAYNRAKRQS